LTIEGKMHARWAYDGSGKLWELQQKAQIENTAKSVVFRPLRYKVIVCVYRISRFVFRGRASRT
jgi:hypothetical protein